MTLWLRFKTFPKIAYVWVRLGIARYFLMQRNKPPKILQHPNKKLKRIAEPWDFEHESQEDLMTLVRKMNAALIAMPYGMRLGLAAPQIGVNKRVFILGQKVIINPEWTPTKAPANQIIEACYSVPNKFFKVSRAQYGWAKWTRYNGQPYEEKLKGLEAIVFQHELDHLNGKCCIDVGEETEAPGRTSQPITK